MIYTNVKNRIIIKQNLFAAIRIDKEYMNIRRILLQVFKALFKLICAKNVIQVIYFNVWYNLWRNKK